MKKIFFCFCASTLLLACGSDGTSNEESGAASAPVTPGIDNVNGNIPDTTGTLRLNRPLPTDSLTGSAADTMNQR
ncbi:MAG TPA: hypothetical protein VEX65_08165 [Flavisolibacter sp.]|nr:hypothetical protein [Flavisolibacter sp.]